MSAINLCLWAAGLALQLVLAGLLFVRGVARRFPFFTLLVIFYILRSVALFSLFGWMARSAYSQLYDLLSFADLCLQVLLAGEISYAILKTTGGWTWRRMAKLIPLAVLALTLAGGSAALLPTPGRVPVDRGTAFTAVLMLVVLAWAVFTRMQGAPRRIVEGFALYGVAGIVIGLERSYAALYRNAAAFAAGSYAQAGVYLAVVVFWLFTLRKRETRTAQSKRAQLRPAVH
jgi:hypothetical protein